MATSNAAYAGARNKVPLSEPGKAVLFVERPTAFNCGKRSFRFRRPDEVCKAMSSKDWERFASEMSSIIDRFWNELIAFVPILMFMFAFLPMTAFMAGVFSLDMNEHELVTSDGSKLRPHCSWADECVWNVGLQLACVSKLCRSAGFDHGMLMNYSNDMCRSSFTATVPENTYQVLWDREEDWGPHLYNNSVDHGLAVMTADCVFKHPAPAWGCMTVLATFPFFLGFAIVPLKVINDHNRNIDQEIYELVFRTNGTIPTRSGCRIEYGSDFTGLCKPSGVRPWRAVIIRGDPGQLAQRIAQQLQPSERAPFNVPFSADATV